MSYWVFRRPPFEQWRIGAPVRVLRFVSDTGASTATASVAKWVAPDATASVGAVSTPATAALAKFITPDATSSSAISVPATAALAKFIVPDATASVGGVTVAASPSFTQWLAIAATVVLGAVSTPASASVARFVVPDATVSVGAVSTAATPSVAIWITPDAQANTGMTSTATAAVAKFVTPDATTSVGAVTTPATASPAKFVAPDAVSTSAISVKAGQTQIDPGLEGPTFPTAWYYIYDNNNERTGAGWTSTTPHSGVQCYFISWDASTNTKAYPPWWASQPGL